jgi:hypothetical protein
MAAATIDEVIDSLIDNADFEEVASVAKASAFVTAANRFFILSPESQADQGSMMRISAQQIENLLRRAQQFVAVNSGGAPRVRFFSASEGFRR